MDALKSFFQERRFYPMLVERNSIGKEMSGMEFNKVWASFDALSEESKDVLMSPEMSQRIESLQKERGILDYHIEIVSAIIREYFLGKKDSLWLENALMAKLDRKDVAFVKEYIQRNILTIKPAPKVSEEDVSVPAVQTVSLPLLDAMAKYQRLSEQNITEDRIMVKGESQPVRGSLRNWVRHYRDNMGIRKHTAIERGQFLFQGENTRRLGAMEREKLSLVFRSLEENEPISIDTERQEILFPVFEERPAPAFSKPANSNNQIGVAFQPIEKFPSSNTPLKKPLEGNVDQTDRAPLLRNASSASRLNAAPSNPARISSPVYPFPIGSSSDFSMSAERSLETPQSEMSPASPFSSPAAKMSFSSSHVLPYEKESLLDESSSENAVALPPRDPKATSIIRPRGERFGFRGTPPPSGGPEE